MNVEYSQNSIISVNELIFFFFFFNILAVSIDGEPQPFDALKSHSNKNTISRAMRTLTTVQWEKHMDGLRNFGILAGQAFEYEYNKNRTEGKTGIVKPDLIPSKSVESPKKEKKLTLTNDVVTNNTKIKKPSPKVSPRTSPLKLIPETEIAESLPLADLTKQASIVDLTRELTTEENTKKIKPINLEINLTETVEPSNTISSSTNLINAETNGHTSNEDAPKAAVISTTISGAARPTLVRSKGSLLACKPPNVLVYSDSSVTRDNVILTLQNILERDM